MIDLPDGYLPDGYRLVDTHWSGPSLMVTLANDYEASLHHGYSVAHRDDDRNGAIVDAINNALTTR